MKNRGRQNDPGKKLSDCVTAVMKERRGKAVRQEESQTVVQ